MRCGAVNGSILLDANEVTPGLLAGDAGGTATHSEVQHRIAWVAVGFNQVLHQPQRLLC